jgi:hypothetical protein
MSEIWSKLYIGPQLVYLLLSICTIVFPHYLINGTLYEKTSLNLKCVFWLSLQRLSETFFIMIRSERDMIKIVYRSSISVPVIVNFYNSFSTLSHTRHVVRKNFTEPKMCVLIFSTSVVWIIFYYNKKWARYDQNCISFLM